MPEYVFSCDCGKTFSEIRNVSQCRRQAKCPRCSSYAERDFAKEHGGYSHRPGNWPAVSESMGVHPSQIGEALELAGKKGVSIEFLPDGRAKFNSARQRKEYCEAFGYFDRNGGYGDPQARNA